MSALGHKRTFCGAGAMSALLPKADMCGAASDVRFGPGAEPAASLPGSVSIANALTFGTYSSLGTVSVYGWDYGTHRAQAI